MCYQFEDSQIISPKIMSYEPSHLTVTNEGSFFGRKFFTFFWYIIHEFLENLIKNDCIRMHFKVV